MTINGVDLSALSASQQAALLSAIKTAVANTTGLSEAYISTAVLPQISSSAVPMKLRTAVSSKAISVSFSVYTPTAVLMNALGTASTTSTALGAAFASQLFAGSGSNFTSTLQTAMSQSTMLSPIASGVSVTSPPTVVVRSDSPTSMPTEAPSPQPTVHYSSSGLSTGAIIGIAVGGGVGVIVMVVLGIFVVKRRCVPVDATVADGKQVAVEQVAAGQVAVEQAVVLYGDNKDGYFL
jgi:hypothetical protein